MRLQVAILLVSFTALIFGVDGNAGPYRLSLVTNPSVVPIGRAKLLIRVTDHQGAPVSDASVKALARMPGMKMGEREEVAMPTGEPGSYSAPAVFSMAGRYEVTVSISSPMGSGQANLPLSTGQASASQNGFNPSLALLLGGLAGAFYIFLRMRATGQTVNIRGLLSRSVMASIVLLAVALAAGIWAVRNLRRVGAMTPLEAQVMEMNTPAPEGTLPVDAAEIREEQFTATVTYSGQVVGFVEQDVVPRVTGTIVSMPVYVGDKVKKGQLLARLDTSQIDPVVAEKSAGVSKASQGVKVADSELAQAYGAAEQARAEATMAGAEVIEARTMLTAAEASRVSSEAYMEGINADRRSAQAMVDSAEAEDSYQRKVLERKRQLYDAGAVSKDELQLAQSVAQRATSTLTAARETLRKIESQQASAKSDVIRAAAEISAASARVTRAQASYRAKLAQVKSAESGVETAKARIGESQADVAEAFAGLRDANTQKSYSELRAEVDGVVTQRLVSAGVVVTPGQAILKVAQVAPVRIQANVPQADLLRIQLGAEAKISQSISAARPLVAKVTSISPAVDLASRMGVVEALFANRSNQFVPGQFVSMEITVGHPVTALVLPASALVLESRGMEDINYVWVISSGPAGAAVTRREVQVSARSQDKVAIAGGLKPGERVVVSPFGLSEGMRVHATSESVGAKSGTIDIQVLESGFSPDSVVAPAGEPIRLRFTRRVENTCATAADFAKLGLHVELPVNKAITLDLPPQPAGKEISYACPMNMFVGKVLIR